MKQKKILLNIMLYLLFSGALSAQVVDDFQVNENEGRCQKYNPSIAVESNGNFIIAWADQRNGNSNIFYQRYDSDGSVLSGNNMVSDFPAGSYQYNPSIAGDASGNFIITWYHEDVITGDHKIYCQRYSTDGTALGGNVQVDIGGMNPSIAMDDSGNFIIVWEEWGNGSNNIYCQRYGSDGVALGNNFRVNDDAGSSTQRNPSIGVDSIGNFMVVWYDNRDGNYDIYCQRYSSDGTSLGSNFKVNDNSGSNYYLYDLSIGVDNSGNFVIVWEDYRNGNCDIYCQRYSSDGMKLGNNFMVNDDAGSSNQYRPSITVDNSGNFIIVWADERNGNYDIYCQRYSTDGTAIGVNFRVNDDSGSSRQDEPCIAVDGSGNFVIAWLDPRVGRGYYGGDIYCQRYGSDGTTLSVNFMVNDDAGSSHQKEPSIAVDISGNFVIAWEDYRNGDGNIYCQRYSSDSTALGNNFRVNEDVGSYNQCRSPSIDMNGSGNFVIAWNEVYTYCQRYNADGTVLGSNFQVCGPNAMSTSIAVDESGHFMIVWEDADRDIYCQRYSADGTPLGVSFKVNDDVGSNNQYRPSIAVDGSGNFMIVWYDFRNGNSDIYCQRYSADGTALGGNFKVNDDLGTYDQTNPRIAANDSGHFVIVWLDYRNGKSDIYCQTYGEDGTALGTNLYVKNDNIFNDRYNPSVAVGENNTFVIVWQLNLSYYDHDIYCQRYDSNNQPVGNNERINSQDDGDHVNCEVKLRNGYIYSVFETNRVPGQGFDIFANVQPFLKPTQYHLTIEIDPEGGGSVIKSPDYAEYDSSTVVELGAIPNPGYYFLGWNGDVADLTSLKTMIIMDSDKTVIAHFQIDPFSKDTTSTLVAEISSSVGSGWADYNLDNYPDLFISCSVSGHDNELYANNQDGTFTRITTGELVNSGGDSWGQSWGDTDNDGDPDLYVANHEENNFFYENNGDNTFTNITSGDFVSTPSSSFGCSSGDYDNDGYLDLFVANWGEANELYHNEQNGTFLKITDGNIVTDVQSSSGCSWADFDNDNDPDLFVSNTGYSALYVNQGNGTFSSMAEGDIVNHGGNSFGGSWGDYDNDGDLDLFVPNGNNQNNFLYENKGDGSFTRIIEGEVVNDSSSSLSSGWGDYDNDGDLDLFVANTNRERNCLYTNNGDGSFSQMTHSIVTADSSHSYSISWCDFDRDGDLDLFVVNWSNYNCLYTNNGNSNHWINIRCLGTFSNSSAIGAKVRVKARIDQIPTWQLREISGQTGRNSQNSMNAQFGLGDATIIDSVRIEWPSGIVQVLTNVTVDQFLIITEELTNNSPVVVHELPDTTLTLGVDTLTIDLAAYSIFADPDGDTLTYTAESSMKSIASASVTDNILTVIPLKAGNTTITVWAHDGQDSTSTSFRVNVPTATGNVIPVVANTINDTTITLNDTLTIDLAADSIFTDPDGDTLTYRAFSSTDSIAAASITNNILTVIPFTPGSATITVWAHDGQDSTSTSFLITVPTVTGNLIPVVINTIRDTTITVNDTLFIDLVADSIFVDPDGDTLTYAATSSVETVGDVHIIENMLMVIPLDTGRTTITVWANDGKDSVSTSFEVTITTMGNQAPSIVHEQIQTSIADQAITVTANISDDRGILSASLHYRRGGDIIFTSTSMSLNGQVYEAMIPDYAVTSRGVEYYLTATDNNNVQTQEPVSGIYSILIQIPSPGVVKSTSQPAGSEQTAYRLTSVPINVTDKTPATIYTDDLGSYDITKYRFFTLESDTGYTEFSTDPVMKAGTAGWLIVKDAGKVIDTGAGITHSTTEAYGIPLRSGWNLVATPFNFTIPRTNLRLGSGNTIELRYYEGSWNNSDVIQVETMVPFEGYALFNTLSSEDTLFVDPDLSSGSQASKKNMEKKENPLWAIHIVARCQQALDMDNTLKIMTNASKGPDPLDRAEPPSIGEYVSLYFSHPEWGTNTHSFCIDSRPEPLEGDIWSFEVKTNINELIELTFEGVETVPEQYEVWLVDEILKITQDLRQNQLCTIAVPGKEHPKALKLVIGLHEFCEEGLQKINTVPKSFTLYQNFPNPFNPATTIRYGLPKAEKVTLKIYNLMGKEVKTLVNGEIKEAGYYVVVWDGRTQRGNRAAAGLYFIQMSAGGFRETRKMVLVE